MLTICPSQSSALCCLRPWYSAAVSTLANAGVIDGYTNGTFGPNKPITRAEFIKLVVAMYGVDDTATASYTDLKSGNWAYPYIATATANGWITGYTNGSCGPTRSMDGICFFVLSQ